MYPPSASSATTSMPPGSDGLCDATTCRPSNMRLGNAAENDAATSDGGGPSISIRTIAPSGWANVVAADTAPWRISEGASTAENHVLHSAVTCTSPVGTAQRCWQGESLQ